MGPGEPAPGVSGHLLFSLFIGAQLVALLLARLNLGIILILAVSLAIDLVTLAAYARDSAKRH